MNIIKINPANPDPKVIEKAARVILKGGSVVLPTDTAYGLAVNALDRKAVKKLFRIKTRAKNKPLPVAVLEIKQAQKLAFFDSRALSLAKEFWPSALTLVLRKKEVVPKEVTGYEETIGLRIPDSRVCLTLADRAQVPYTITSANISGGEIPYSVLEVVRQFENRKWQPDLILDGGTLVKIKPSTVVDLSEEGEIKVLRQGEVEINAKRKNQISKCNPK